MRPKRFIGITNIVELLQAAIIRDKYLRLIQHIADPPELLLGLKADAWTFYPQIPMHVRLCYPERGKDIIDLSNLGQILEHRHPPLIFRLSHYDSEADPIKKYDSFNLIDLAKYHLSGDPQSQGPGLRYFEFDTGWPDPERTRKTLSQFSHPPKMMFLLCEKAAKLASGDLGRMEAQLHDYGDVLECIHVPTIENPDTSYVHDADAFILQRLDEEFPNKGLVFSGKTPEASAERYNTLRRAVKELSVLTDCDVDRDRISDISAYAQTFAFLESVVH